MHHRSLAAAPDPAAVPSPGRRRVAYTALERTDTVVGGPVTVHRVRVDGTAAALAAFDARDGPSGRALAGAVDDWESTADADGVAGIVAAGKKPRPWVVGERPPLPLGTTADGDAPPLDLDRALYVATRVADAVATAHERETVHGALTPRTVRSWPAPGSTWPLPRVLDWGLARARLSTATGEGGDHGGVAVVGAGDGDAGSVPEDRHFLAPETPAGDPSPAVDVYGVGALSYWLLTGETVRAGASPVPPSTIRPTLPGAVDDPVLAALSADPARRPTVETLRADLDECLRAETGTDSRSEAGRTPGGDDRSTDAGGLPSAFPLFDGSRADWRAPCPDCGRSVNNTVRSFVDHWVDAGRCDGPPVVPPGSLTGLTDPEYATVVEHVERLRRERDDGGDGLGDHPLLAALADDARAVRSVGGVDVQRPDGTFPWLDRPRRGWRVPCPDCDEPVFNALSAFRSHWADAADCDGPPDQFRAR